jgi:hypothetical protein
MGFTTLTALVSACAGLTVTGVASTSRFAFRPKSINSAQLPMLYTRLPQRKRENATLGYVQGLKAGTIEIVILVAMMNLGKQEANDALTVTMIDNLGDALESNAAALGMDGYVIEADEDTIGDGATPVQVIVATVEVSG